MSEPSPIAVYDLNAVFEFVAFKWNSDMEMWEFVCAGR